MSGKEHREGQRDNARQLEIEAAHNVLTEHKVSTSPSFSLPQRIKMELCAKENHIKWLEGDVDSANGRIVTLATAKDAEIAKRDEVIAGLNAEAGAFAVEIADRDLQIETLTVKINLLDKAYQERGKTIKKLEKRIATNFQDESLAVRERDERIEELESLTARLQGDVQLLNESAHVEQERSRLLEEALEHATNQVTEPVDEPDVPAEFEPPLSDEEKLGNIEIEKEEA